MSRSKRTRHQHPLGQTRCPRIENQKIELSRSEQAEYQRMRGSLLRMILERMFASHGYQELQDDQKVEEVQEATRRAEQFAREQMVARPVKRRNEEKAAKSTGIPYEPPSQIECSQSGRVSVALRVRTESLRMKENDNS
jgi:hypothetical protein